jgi:hypothetical protein
MTCEGAQKHMQGGSRSHHDRPTTHTRIHLSMRKCLHTRARISPNTSLLLFRSVYGMRECNESYTINHHALTHSFTHSASAMCHDRERVSRDAKSSRTYRVCRTLRV